MKPKVTDDELRAEHDRLARVNADQAQEIVRLRAEVARLERARRPMPIPEDA